MSKRPCADTESAHSAKAAKGDTATKLWGGRFTGKTDPLMENFNASISYDKRLWRVDIAGSCAYARALLRCGILSAAECAEIVRGLKLVGEEWATGTFEIKVSSDEDIHTANERRLSELIGDVAGKLHTGRSRNDQVATDVRLWLRHSIATLHEALCDLLRTACGRAREGIDIIMPGYTHLQVAQPIRWSHWIMGHAAAWQRDAERLQQCLTRVNRMPLGSGALAGHPFHLDRVALAKDPAIAFMPADAPPGCVSGLLMNSLDAVGDRDFILEYMFIASCLMVHLSRWAEDLIIYNTNEFGFVAMADAYSTGSSLMPQKKNPDALELLRGKAGRITGNLSGFLTTCKGLPTTYNKDLQEDKEPLFDTADTLDACVRIACGVMSTIQPRAERMRQALVTPMLATDLCDYLVRRGMPFRKAHHVAGRAIILAEDRGVPLTLLSLTDLAGLEGVVNVPLPDTSPHSTWFNDDVHAVWSYDSSVEARCAKGGTSRATVIEQVEGMEQWLHQHVSLPPTDVTLG